MHDQVLDLYERPGFATQPNSGVEADLNLDFSTTFSVTDIKQSISNGTQGVINTCTEVHTKKKDFNWVFLF